MTKRVIKNISPDTKGEIRHAVSMAVEYWPNAHLGNYSPREDIRSAFQRIRRWAEHTDLKTAIWEVERDAYAHSDM